MDFVTTLRTIAQQIHSVTHYSVTSRNILHRLKQCGMSSRRPLLRLPFTGNNKSLRHQWYGGHGQQKGTTLCLPMNSASNYYITRVGFESKDTVTLDTGVGNQPQTKTPHLGYADTPQAAATG
ncbi:hypothetical protein TNCV_2267261 [Trichonephila clavipes]|nr:hypothetical protein TNCV_2267261 [Trichonephila clavipes]